MTGRFSQRTFGCAQSLRVMTSEWSVLARRPIGPPSAVRPARGPYLAQPEADALLVRLHAHEDDLREVDAHGAVRVLDVEPLAAGVELIDKTPRIGIRGSRVAFCHPRSTGGVLTEIVEPAEAH